MLSKIFIYCQKIANLHIICKPIIRHKFNDSVESIQDVRHCACSVFFKKRFVADCDNFDDATMFQQLIANEVQVGLKQKKKKKLIKGR